MKKLLLSLTMVLAMFAASAQNITVTEKETGNVVENGATYFVFGDGSELWGEIGGEMQIEFDVTANENMRVVAKKTPNDPIVEGTSTWLCFGQCLAPSTGVQETNPEEMTAGNPMLFSGHYMADNYTTVLSQEQSVTFELWNAANPDEKFVINVIFKYSLDDVAEVSAQNVISAYPTPATSVINFDYNVNGNAMVVIYNMMGQEVMRNEIAGQNGTLSMNVSDLNSGVYFYSLVINGKTEKSNKIVIR
ncbi:MAG: T9SS type A sorting domain-containing protein [Bacteroidales bacterium]|nr:T9SS type A sorting domain-containing protein [Bacteroidales bacterium]